MQNFLSAAHCWMLCHGSPESCDKIWIDVSVRCPHTERNNESSSKPGFAATTSTLEGGLRLESTYVHRTGNNVIKRQRKQRRHFNGQIHPFFYCFITLMTVRSGVFIFAFLVETCISVSHTCKGASTFAWPYSRATCCNILESFHAIVLPRASQ